MKIIVLGSGTGIPNLQRNAPGYYLSAAKQEMLVDCGSATLLQLERAKKSYQNLDLVCITHTHVDHIGDLAPLIHALRLPGFVRTKPLTIMGPPGFAAFFTNFIEPIVGMPKGFAVHVIEAPLHHKSGVLQIASTTTLHSSHIASVAYRFSQENKHVVFSGDCDYDPEIANFANQADLLILDCSTLQANKISGHLSAAECGKIATQASVKQLLLTHLYPIKEADEVRIEECGANFSGSIKLANDLMEINI